jgi:hypothetical protein
MLDPDDVEVLLHERSPRIIWISLSHQGECLTRGAADYDVAVWKVSWVDVSYVGQLSSIIDIPTIRLYCVG